LHRAKVLSRVRLRGFIDFFGGPPTYVGPIPFSASQFQPSLHIGPTPTSRLYLPLPFLLIKLQKNFVDDNIPILLLQL